MKDKRVTEIVVSIIKERHPLLFQLSRGYKDDAGNRIHVREDGICWETVEWLDYEVMDRINERIEALGLDIVAEYSNDYEVMIEPLS